MAKGKKQQEEVPGFGQEMAAVSGVVLAIFLLLSLISYSLSGPAGDAANWCGTVGGIIAGSLLSFLGISSFLVVFLFFFFSFQFFFNTSDLERLPQICLGSTGLLIAGCGLVGAMLPEKDAVLVILGMQYPAGGYLGRLLFSFLGNAFGGPGTVLLLSTLLLFSLMVAVRFSPYILGRECIRLCGKLIDLFDKEEEGSPASSGSIRQQEKPAEVIAEPGPDHGEMPQVREPLHLTSSEDDFQLQPLAVGDYQLPPLTLLEKVERPEKATDKEHYYNVSRQLEEKLKDFGVVGKVVGISPGPVITTYEFSPAPGVKINKVASLADDLALGLKAESVRIVGSIPGKAALGIEIPNPEREVVYIRDMLASDAFKNGSSKLTLALGMDVVGKPVMADLAKMPHLLIAGATGSGKSVAVNAIIASILYKATPEEVRLLMVDPKRIELSGYENIPHLLHPVVVDPKMASRALMWAVREMERRYLLLEEAQVKSFDSYNVVSEEKLPLIVIIVDELADLMMVASKDVENAIARLAQMARAAGIHLILATQRPSVDVLTGLIKANFPTRLSFKVSSKVDSRTILDTSGAEHLLGAGDLLYLAPGTARLQRLHGAYISEKETESIVGFLREQGTAQYDESVLSIAEEADSGGTVDDDEYDEKYDEAVAIVCETGHASISMIQRRLRVGYNRAARMIEIMEKEGVVGPADGSRPREVLTRKDYN
jgi:S-DNA-T family DNA segregation ATPase FtsK/SpoIIIE